MAYKNLILGGLSAAIIAAYAAPGSQAYIKIGDTPQRAHYSQTVDYREGTFQSPGISTLHQNQSEPKSLEEKVSPDQKAFYEFAKKPENKKEKGQVLVSYDSQSDAGRIIIYKDDNIDKMLTVIAGEFNFNIYQKSSDGSLEIITIKKGDSGKYVVLNSKNPLKEKPADFNYIVEQFRTFKTAVGMKD